jgi:hypothetical protein
VATVFVRSSHKPSPEEEYGEYLKGMTHYSGLYIDINSIGIQVKDKSKSECESIGKRVCEVLKKSSHPTANKIIIHSMTQIV